MNNIMSFEDKGRAFEAHFASQQEVLFKIKAKTTHLVAQWAADRIGLDEHHSAKFIAELGELTVTDGGKSKLKERLLNDFSANKIDISDHALDRLFILKENLAAQQVLKEVSQVGMAS